MDEEQKGPIKFYTRNEQYGEFSNFYKAPTTIQGIIYPTNEHYFQSKKFHPTPDEQKIAKVKTPYEAFKLGQSHVNRRQDWQEVKEAVMYEGLKFKFSQNEHCRKVLLSTGDREIIEHTVKDKYWADGGDGSGKNRLGHLLMKLRKELREEN